MVILFVISSVRPSLRLSVTLIGYVKMNKYIKELYDPLSALSF